MQPIKVVHISTVHPTFDSRIFHKECVSLAAAGYQVLLIAQADASQMVEQVQIKALPKAKSRFDRVTRIMFYAFRAALSEKAAIYHFHDPELIIMGLVLRLLGKKVIYDVHEDVPQDILVKEYLPKLTKIVLAKVMQCLEWIAGLLFTAIVTVTPKIAARFPQRKTFLVRNFPNLTEFSTLSNQDYATREPILLYVGSISVNRGIEQMLAVLQLLNQTMPVRLYLAGAFTNQALKQKCEAQPAWQYVNCFGQLSRQQLLPLFAKAKIGLSLLHPTNSFIHAYPIKLFEYMAAGLPVVASDFPLWREIVATAECGKLVDPLAVVTIATVIKDVLQHSAIAQTMGLMGKQAVLEKYNWVHEEKMLLEIYSRLIQ